MPPHHHRPPHPGEGLPHDKHGRPHHPGPPRAHDCVYNSEEELPLSTIGNALAGFGRALVKKGGVSLRSDLEVRPPNLCEMIVRFDRTGGGHDILKIELKWNSDHVVVGDSMSELLALAQDGEAELSDEPARAGEAGLDREVAR